LSVASLRAGPLHVAAVIGLAASALIGGAWFIESLGYLPCELCLLGRVPYYVGIGVAAATVGLAAWGRADLARWGLFALTLVFAAGTAIAVYHTGVELHFWPGPSECTGATPHAASTQDFLARLKKVKPIRCDEPALYILGLSLAAWSALASAGLTLAAWWGWRQSAPGAAQG
jgi:disulfide bond formation protein DsbB